MGFYQTFTFTLELEVPLSRAFALLNLSSYLIASIGTNVPSRARGRLVRNPLYFPSSRVSILASDAVSFLFPAEVSTTRLASSSSISDTLQNVLSYRPCARAQEWPASSSILIREIANVGEELVRDVRCWYGVECSS